MALHENIPFIGRENFLECIDSCWRKNTVICIHGLRAVGKSRTLFHFLQMKKNTLTEDDQTITKLKESQFLYVDLRTLNDFDTVCSNLCAQLGIIVDQTNRNIPYIVMRICEVLNKSSDIIFTTIFDNAEDIIENVKEPWFLSLCSELAKHNINIKIVLTSTTKASFASVAKGQMSLELLPLTNEESTIMLRCLTESVDYMGQFDTIMSLCEGLPLVIIMVASELTRGIPASQMVDFLKDCRIEALNRDSYPADKRVGDVYNKFINRLTQVLKDRLAILGYIPGSFNVWEAKEMLGHETEAETKWETILPIRSRNMIQNTMFHNLPFRRFDIHGILRECLRLYQAIPNLPDVRNRYCRTFAAIMQRLSARMDTKEYSQAVLEFTVEHPNLERLLKDVLYTTEDTYNFYIEIVSSCNAVIEKFMSTQGEKFYNACLQLAERNGSPMDIAVVYLALGNLHTNSKGEYSSGGEIFEKALSLLEYGPPNKRLAVVCTQFGYNLYMQGRGYESLRVLTKSLETLRLLGQQNTEDFLATMSFLGVSYTFIGRYEEAEKYFFDTLNRRIELQGENHPGVGDQLNRLGILYEQMGQMEKARYYFEKGLEKKRQTNATKISVVYSLSNVGRQYGEIGDFEKAESTLTEAMNLLESDGVTNIGAIGLIHNSFGKVYLRKKDYKEAVKHMSESVRIKEKIMQSDPGPFFINPLILLARAHEGCGNYGAAISRLHQALSYKDHILNKLPQNDLMYQCYEALSSIYKALGNKKLEEDMKFEMEKELFRLVTVYEEKANETKIAEFNRKLKELWKDPRDARK